MKIDKTLLNQTGIYQLKIENHIYIGSSINLLYRLRKHFGSLKNGYHDNIYLQRCVDKYGIDKLTYSILEILPKETSLIELLTREKYFIDLTQADLNLKKDPITQQNCVTVCKKVYQFNQFGEFIKEWESESAAARYYNINSSNIVKACKNPKRQRLAAEFLWSYEPIYPHFLKIIYVFDLDGNFLSKHINTIDIYQTYFSNINRKTVLTQLKKKIDNPVPYKNIYLSSTLDFTISNKKQNVLEYEWRKYFKEYNPIIIICNTKGEISRSLHFMEIQGKFSILKKIQKLYTLNEIKNLPEIILEKENSAIKKIKIKNIITNEEKIYPSITKSVIGILGYWDISFYRNAIKHMVKGKPYKGYLFIRDF